MLTLVQSTRVTTAVLVVITLLATIILLLSPIEQTLGNGIRIVYLHVALIWVGMAGLLIAGLLGLIISAVPAATWLTWLRVTSWVAFGFFSVGAIISLVAEIVNWGAIFWSEPRTASILQILAVAVIIQITGSWLNHARLYGLLHAALAGFMVWSTGRAELVLHPDNPIGTSSSTCILATASSNTPPLSRSASVRPRTVCRWRRCCATSRPAATRRA